MAKFPEIVCFKVTSRCNLNCKYCFSYSNNKDLSFSEIKKIIQYLYKNKVKAIIVTGGEPLLRKDIGKILKEIKKYNIKIHLDTNADLFFKYKKAINNYVDILRFSIDPSTETDYYRGRNNQNNVINALDYYKKQDIAKKQNNKIKLRVGTVITKENINNLKVLADTLKNYEINIWKISQFIPSGINGIKNKSLKILTKIFNRETKIIKKEYSKYFKIVTAIAYSRSKDHFFINSDGTIYTPENTYSRTKYKHIGNIFDKNILKKWIMGVNLNNYLNNNKKCNILIKK